MTAPATRIDRDSLRGRLILMLAAMVTASVLAVGYAAILAFDRAVEPELANRTRLIGTIIRAEIERALELGIPIDAIAGLDRYLDDTLEKFAEVERITIATAGGQSLAMAERPAARSLIAKTGLGEVIAVRRTAFNQPILEGNRLVGQITVEISPQFVQTRLRDVFLDVLVLGLIATLVALELALAVTIISVGKPLDRVFRLLGEQREGNFQHRIRPGGLSGLGRTAARLNDHAEDLAARAAAIPDALRSTLAARLPAGRPLRLRLSNFNDIRLALFLFALGTEIAAAFMPLYARDAARPDWISAEFAAAAPLIFYLGAIAAISPFGSMLIRLVGARRLFLVSAPGAGVALVGLGLSTSVISITIWQGVMAAFYATASIAGQEYAIRAAGEKDRAKAVGAFIAVVYGGLFAGSALGGLLAGRFGFEVAFFTGAALAVISVILGASSMRGRAGDRVEGREEGASDPAAVRFSPRSWLTGRYLALLLGVAVPMNATMVIYVWYLAPLMLSDSGSGPAEIARVLLLYNLAIVLFGPTVARLADGRPGPAILLTTGAAISGASLLSLTVWGGFWAIACALAGVGIGQVLMQTPIYALALRLTGGLGRGIDALRLIERLGAIAGLVISAVLLGAIGAQESLRFLGLAVLAGIVVFVIVSATGRQRSA